MEVQVEDPVRTSAFYRQLFGWTFFDHGPAYSHYLTARLDGRAVADIGPRPPGEPLAGPPSWLVCFAVDSADAAAEKIAKAGGTLLLPPDDVGTHGRFAVASDPVGARFAVWQANEYLGAEVAGLPGSVAWHHCPDTDIEAVKDFYADVFGLSATRVPGRGHGCATLDLDGRPVAGLGASGGDTPSRMPPSWRVTFGVLDVGAAVAKVVELGGSLLDGPFDTPRGRCALVADEQGTSFEVLAVGAA
ncbi:VOC family protein [Streptomyces sp. NPDC060006]|uniref:VOC family protein n=1 Tax=unclassified Streptomyces TaxID=2593676 RepID=UPI0036AF3F3E